MFVVVAHTSHINHKQTQSHRSLPSPTAGLTWCRVGRLWGRTRGSGPELVVKQVAQSAQAVTEVLQGYWSGGGHCRPWGSSRQQWGSPGLIQDRKSSSQLAGGLAMYVLPGSRAAALTCTITTLVVQPITWWIREAPVNLMSAWCHQDGLRRGYCHCSVHKNR